MKGIQLKMPRLGWSLMRLANICSGSSLHNFRWYSLAHISQRPSSLPCWFRRRIMDHWGKIEPLWSTYLHSHLISMDPSRHHTVFSIWACLGHGAIPASFEFSWYLYYQKGNLAVWEYSKLQIIQADNLLCWCKIIRLKMLYYTI